MLSLIHFPLSVCLFSSFSQPLLTRTFLPLPIISCPSFLPTSIVSHSFLFPTPPATPPSLSPSPSLVPSSRQSAKQSIISKDSIQRKQHTQKRMKRKTMREKTAEESFIHSFLSFPQLIQPYFFSAFLYISLSHVQLFFTFFR